jgi:hypothetical protein
MRSAEEILKENIPNIHSGYPVHQFEQRILSAIEAAQKEAYNQAIRDAAEKAKMTTTPYSIVIDKQSILSLIKK